MRLVTAFENMSTPIPLDRFFCFVVESLILVTQIILLDDDIIEFAFILINPSLETNFDRFGANDRLDTRQIHRTIIMSYEKRAAGGKMANQIGPKNVVGRDKLIDSVWRKLETNSLRFTAERRVGKTTVMTKMSAEPQPGYHVFFMDVEGIDSPKRFAELVINRVQPLASTGAKVSKWWDDFREALGGVEVGKIIKLPETNKLSWQDTLTKTLEGICEHNKDTKILLIFDELPYMLQKIASIGGDNESKTQAITLLDTLRSVRQKYTNLRMIYAGSVGLHHVLNDIKQDKLASQPVNDMPLVEIRAISQPDAITLASQLLIDERVDVSPTNRIAVLERLVDLSDCVPFYIQHVCYKLAESEQPVDVESLEKSVNSQLTSDQDPWEMEHFRKRLSIYYSGTINDITGKPLRDDDIARAILDHMATLTHPQSIEQIWNVVKSSFQLNDRNHIVNLLKSLALDHYLNCDQTKRYYFRFPLIQKWWKLAQGLEG